MQPDQPQLRTLAREHVFSDAERTWLEFVARADAFDPRVAKVQLRDQLPAGFDPRTIDARFYAQNKLTLLGLRFFSPENPLFDIVGRVIEAIRNKVLAEPGFDTITAVEIAANTGLSEVEVSRALSVLGTLNRFTSGGTSAGSTGLSSISLQGDDAYDAYLTFTSLDSLLDQQYRDQDPSNYGSGGLTISGNQFAQFPAGNVAVLEPPVKRNTAFVIMAIDPEDGGLVDVLAAIKETCREYGITAYRADEIEHQDRITDRILDEIRTCEHLIADLSLERPNVYYEVGFAHALAKKPILYRRRGTRLHFDLSVHNVPEYRNATELREQLRQRLEAIVGHAPKAL